MVSHSVEPRPMVLDGLPRVPCQWLLLVEPPIRHLELRNLILKWDCHFRSILGVASSQAIFPLPWLAIAFRYISMSCFVVLLELRMPVLPAGLVNFIHLKPSPPPQPHVLCKHCCMVDQMYLLPQVHLRLFEMSWPDSRILHHMLCSHNSVGIGVEGEYVGRLGHYWVVGQLPVQARPD